MDGHTTYVLTARQREAVTFWSNVAKVFAATKPEYQHAEDIVCSDMLTCLARVRELSRSGQLTDNRWRWILLNAISDTVDDIQRADNDASRSGNTKTIPGGNRQDTDIRSPKRGNGDDQCRGK